MAKKPFYPSKGALLRKRRRAGATRNWNEAPGGKETGIDPLEGIEKIENDPQRGEGTSETERERQRPPGTTLAQAVAAVFTSAIHPLTASVSKVLREVQHEKFLRWPSHMRSDPAKRDNTKYCEFHRDHGHRTDDCIQLRKEIEYLIRRGHLSHYVASEGQDQVQPPPPRQPTLAQHQLPLEVIYVISGVLQGAGNPA